MRSSPTDVQAAEAVDASAAAAEQATIDMSWVAEWAAKAAATESDELESGEEQEKGSKEVTAASAEEAAVDPATAGLAAMEKAEAVAMEKAAKHYKLKERSLDVALDQLQW